jgi:hypothetical protein
LVRIPLGEEVVDRLEVALEVGVGVSPMTLKLILLDLPESSRTQLVELKTLSICKGC